jgi:hypothetical protein
MRRAALAALVALAAAAPGHAARPAPSWAQPAIDVVVSRGLMAADAATFRPNDVLTQGELTALVTGLAGKPPAVAAPAAAPVTLAGLDVQLVRAVGLEDAAAAVTRAARRAGLAPPGRFGAEVVARLLGLRKNHLAASEHLELLPNDLATRAEAAYSAARVLRLGSAEIENVRAAAMAFALPVLDPLQRQVLAAAARFVGFPYVWGGESERAEGPAWPFGPQVQGGFDCSGYAWRVYRLQAYPDAPALAGVLRGRTTFGLSGEVPRAARIPLATIAPGDLLFFGTQGARSTPAQIIHLSIYAGNGWMLHSSDRGVTLVPLTGWYRTSFAWARRPLAEAGLAAAPTS